MAQYCMYCEQTFISFTHLRSHTCSVEKPLRKPTTVKNKNILSFFQSDKEKDSWIDQLLAQSASLNPNLKKDKMEDSPIDNKTEYKYTIEMNENVDSEMIENNPELSKVLVQSKETFVMQKASEESEEKSDFVYVLEDKAKDARQKVNHSDDNLAVLDLSGCNKRKRKSSVLSELPSLEESKLVIDERDISETFDDNENVENQPNKIQVTDKMINDMHSDGKMSPDSGFGNLNGDISDDGALDFSSSKLDTKLSSPEVHYSKHSGVIDFSTPKVKSENIASKTELFTPMSQVIKTQGLALPTSTVTSNTQSAPASSISTTSTSSRKNRRKRSIPVRCERNLENTANDFTDIIQDYAVEPELVNKSENVKSETEVKNVKTDFKLKEYAPIDLTPKSATSAKSSTSPCTPEESSIPSPVDLSARKSPEMVKSVVKQESSSPVDLSAANGKKSSMQPLPMIPGANFPGLLGGDPLQMRQMFEMMYRMSPNHNIMQAQLMQFHALLQNSMVNNRLAQMNNLNTIKSADAIKSDKNDNIIKTENDSSNDSIEPELQSYSMNFMQKNGMLNSAFTSPGINPMMAGQAFTPSPVNSFRGKPGRRKNKDPLLTPESSPASPKIESKLPPIEFDSNSSPDHVIETLQKFFPMMTNAENPKQVDDNIVRFFVKDNDQIQVIVDSLLNVGVLDLQEQEIHVSEPVYKYICRVCKQTFFHVEHLTKHVKKQHIVKKYQCTECDRSFHDAGNYRQHMRVHDDTDIPYECDVCNRRFRHKCTLKVHMRIHTGEKPFKCDVCGATFKISSGLQTHMRKHTGETPYACEFCDLRFKCQSNLKQHLFQHTQVRPFPCDICGKTYSRKSIRDAHLLTHAKEYIKNGITDISQVPMAGNLSQTPMGGGLSQVPMGGDISKVPMTVGGME